MAKRGLGRISISELLAEVMRRRRDLPGLKKRRQRLSRELAEVDQQIQALGGGSGEVEVKRGPGRPRGTASNATQTSGGRRRRRTNNAASLVDSIASVLERDRPKSVGEIVDGVKNSGYRSSSANFRALVAQTLSKNPQFKRAGRGQYVLK